MARLPASSAMRPQASRRPTRPPQESPTIDLHRRNLACHVDPRLLKPAEVIIPTTEPVLGPSNAQITVGSAHGGLLFDALINPGEERRAALPMAAPSGTVLSERRQSQSLDDPTWHDAGGGVVNVDSGQSSSRHKRRCRPFRYRRARVRTMHPAPDGAVWSCAANEIERFVMSSGGDHRLRLGIDHFDTVLRLASTAMGLGCQPSLKWVPLIPATLCYRSGLPSIAD